jgi:hypothetical protein
MNKKSESLLKNTNHLSQHDLWMIKSLVTTVELLDKVVTEVKKLREEIEEIKNPKIESMLNMKRGNPFKEGTN